MRQTVLLIVLICNFLFVRQTTVKTVKFEFIRDWSIDGVYAITVQGDYAYLGSNEYLYIVKLSESKRSCYETRLKIGGIVDDISLEGNYLYVADRKIGLQIFDISDFKNPKKLGSYLAPDVIRDIWVVDNLGGVFLAANKSGVIVIDISKKDSLKELEKIPVPNSAWAVMVAKSFICISDYYEGLIIIFKNTEDSLWVKRIPIDGVGLGFYWQEPYLYYAIGDSGLQIYNVSNPSKPITLGRCPRSHPSNVIFSWSVQVVDNYAFVADMGGLQIIDVKNPKKPKQIGYYPTIDDGIATKLYVSRSENPEEYIVYLTLGGSGLRILKVKI